MAKLVNKILGDPIGKIAYLVGIKWKDSIYSIRGWVKPTQRGTVTQIGSKWETINGYKQMNNRIVMRVLGFLGRSHLANWIDVIWSPLAIARGKVMTGINLFVQQNQSRLYNSFSNKSLVYNAASNAPDLSLLKVSDGDLEPIESIASAVYTTGTGALVVTFSSSVYGNGAATDLVYGMWTRKPLVDTDYYPKLWMAEPSRGNTKTRTDGTVTFTLPTGLTVTDLMLFLFVKDAAATIGYSPSTSHTVS